MKARPGLIWLVVLALAAALWDVAWVPLSTHRDALAREAGEAQRIHRWVQQTLPRLSASAPVSSVTDAQSAAQAIHRVAQRYAIERSVSRIEPRANEVRVQLKGAPFELAVAWVSSLEIELGLRVVRLELTPNEAPGLVDGRLITSVGRP